MNPLLGKPVIFAPHKCALTVSYLRFVLVRNRSNDDYIVLLSGTSYEVVEAGEKFFMLR
jgi:hypothetical protein